MLKSSVMLTLVILIAIFAYGCFDEPTSPANQSWKFSRAEVIISLDSSEMLSSWIRLSGSESGEHFDTTSFEYIDTVNNNHFSTLHPNGYNQDSVFIYEGYHYSGNDGTQLTFIIDVENNKLLNIYYNKYWREYIYKEQDCILKLGFTAIEMLITKNTESIIEAEINGNGI